MKMQCIFKFLLFAFQFWSNASSSAVKGLYSYLKKMASEQDPFLSAVPWTSFINLDKITISTNQALNQNKK